MDCCSSSGRKRWRRVLHNSWADGYFNLGLISISKYGKRRQVEEKGVKEKEGERKRRRRST